ncbi:MAG: hybrid sensor histidine kinase/response regulator [Candidatus Cloacimonetes bacterium]|nr:hybrid sensor histidine kinase/response regulator [Candidatus Cloacimonadota bacterium]
MKILVVDDQFVVRQLIRDELEAGGYEVFEASSGQDALIKLVQNPVDLITLDIAMPGMNGYTTCSRLRSERYRNFINNRKDRDLPVIFITAADSPKERQKGFDVGAIDYFVKPFKKGTILKAVNNILRPLNQHGDLLVAILYSDETMRVNLSNEIQKQGVHFECFNDIATAIEWMEQHHQRLGLILIDHHVETLPALEVLKATKENPLLMETPKLVFWDKEEAPNLIHFYAAGCNDSLQTPFIQEEVTQKISTLLNNFNNHKKRLEMLNQLKELDSLKDKFLSACSHDLRNPIGAIVGFSSLLLDEVENQEHQEFLTMIQQSCQEMTQMIDSLLSIDKVKSGKTEVQSSTINLQSELQEIVNKYISNNYKNLTYTLDFYLTNPIIQMDKGIFQRIINNLLSNATKFTPKLGVITISANTIDDIFFQLSIKDTGMGIPKDSLPLLFDEYSGIGRLGTEGETSVGLGMSITKTLISNLGGTISVESQENLGTEFSIILPLGIHNG